MIVSGDLLKADVDIIIQQVNCSRKMGAGLSGKIMNKYPNVKNQYLGFIRKFMEGDDKRSLLGRVNYVDVYDGRLVANVFGQVEVRKGRKDRGKYTEEEYLLLGMDEVFRYAEWRGYTIGIPYRIGCDNGGGDWDVVYAGIEALNAKYDVVCKIYHHKRGIWGNFK